MDLPIAPQTYQPSADALVRAIKRVDVMLARTAAVETPLDVATVFTHADRPHVHMVNFAADVRCPEGQTSAQVFDAIDTAFAQAGTSCFRVMAADTHWSADLAAEAQVRGYAKSSRQLLLLQSYTPPSLNEALQVIPARAAYPQMRAFSRQAAIDEQHVDARVADDLAATQIDHLDEPRVEAFLGRLDGEAAGVVKLVTLGQIGVIDDVYVAPAFRRRGVAATLLAHTMDHCQRALFEQVILEVDAADREAQRLYTRLGFKPATEFHHYQRGL
jgi:putative acetyltransferase